MHGTCKKHGHSRMPSSHHPKTKAHRRSDTLELSIRMLPSSPAFAVRVIPAAPCGLTLRPACIPSGLSRPSYGSNEPQTGVSAPIRTGKPRPLPCSLAYQKRRRAGRRFTERRFQPDTESASVPGGSCARGEPSPAWWELYLKLPLYQLYPLDFCFRGQLLNLMEILRNINQELMTQSFHRAQGNRQVDIIHSDILKQIEPDKFSLIWFAECRPRLLDGFYLSLILHLPG